MDGRDVEGGSDWLQTVSALEAEGRRAFIVRDLERLSALWSDQLRVNAPINRVNHKQQVLDLLRSGTIAHSSLDATIEHIERHGDLVVVMGSERVTNAAGGATVTRRFTNVWRLEEGSWRMLVRHANIVPASM